MRHAARVDANQSAVVEALRAVGARVWIIGLPVDLLIGHKGKLMLMEIKDGSKVPSARKKTALQDKFFSEWTDLPISMADSPQAALRHLATLVGEA